MIWGYHTTFDCKFGDKNKITNEDNIRSFVEALVVEFVSEFFENDCE